MQEVDEILIPRWLVPVDTDNAAASVREDCAAAIHNDKIVAVDSLAAIRANYTGAEIALPKHALLPGFVNAHTHAAMTILRGYADDLPLLPWLQEKIWPAEAKFADAEFVAAGTDLALVEMLKSGTTCFNDMYFFPEVTAARAEAAGLRACVGMIVIDFPNQWAQTADECISKGLELRDGLRHSALITAAFAPHAPHTVADAAFEKIATLAEESDIPIHMHIHESADEINMHTERYGMRPLARLEQLDLLGPRLAAVHMTQLQDGEMETIAARGVTVVHCPQSNMKLASGFCPVAELQTRGVNLALGTDGAASNNDLDLMGEMQFAALLAKGVSEDACALSARQAIFAATYGGARALGLDAHIGSITPGKQADLIAIDLSDAATLPLYNPLSQIVYSANRNQVSDAWVGGQRVLRDRQLTTLDEAEIVACAQQIAARIQQ